MAEVIVLATSFPSVFYTVLLGVVLVYWTFVMVGAIDLGEGADGALDGHLEGAAKGIAEAAAGGADGDIDFDGGDGGDGGDGAAEGHEAGAFTALVSALRLRKVPATLALSLIITFAWLVSVVAMQVLTRSSAAAAVLEWVVLLVSPIVALPLAAIVIRPLSTVFAHRSAPSRADLVGKTCVVRTGKVTHAFGEGTLADGGAGLIVRLRIDGPRELRRGDHALIVDFDPKREAFVVEPIDELLTERKN